MHEQNKAIIKALVSVAWADGNFGEKESECLSAFLSAYDASEQEMNELREYAKTQRTLDEIPLTDLSADDRRVLLHHAVLMSLVDGEQGHAERIHLNALCLKLRISADEATRIERNAQHQAERLRVSL